MKYLIKPALYIFLLFFISFPKVAKPTNLWDSNIIPECIITLTSSENLWFINAQAATVLKAISGKVLREPQETTGVLESILETSANVPDTVAVFDLSSTLFRVSPRIINTFKEFAQKPEIQSRFSEEASFLNTLEDQYELNQLEPLVKLRHIKQTLIGLGLQSSHPDFFTELHTFLVQHFFFDDHLKHNFPYEGTVDFVNRLYQNGTRIIYLTGRNVGEMCEGTLQALCKHGFPLDGTQAQLVMQPERGRGLQTANFKLDYLNSLQGNHVWFFDNKPININVVNQSLSHIESIYFASTHFEDEHLLESNTPRVQSFLIR